VIAALALIVAGAVGAWALPRGTGSSLVDAGKELLKDTPGSPAVNRNITYHDVDKTYGRAYTSLQYLAGIFEFAIIAFPAGAVIFGAYYYLKKRRYRKSRAAFIEDGIPLEALHHLHHFRPTEGVNLPRESLSSGIRGLGATHVHDVPPTAGVNLPLESLSSGIPGLEAAHVHRPTVGANFSPRSLYRNIRSFYNTNLRSSSRQRAGESTRPHPAGRPQQDVRNVSASEGVLDGTEPPASTGQPDTPTPLTV
jgi:hypothetical protein